MKSNRSNQSKQNYGTALASGVTLLAGAAIGSAVMYFFDPQIGRPRRRRVQDAAHEAFDQGKSAMGAALGAAAKQAGHVADRLSDRLSHAGDSAARMAGERIRHAAHRADDAREQAAHFATRQSAA